ncbi:MAG: hypothetical protein CL885_02670 [Dehalococcoidia bacterium]|nr:hypothetical protein [Dehalococcoidia bacterium]
MRLMQKNSFYLLVLFALGLVGQAFGVVDVSQPKDRSFILLDESKVHPNWVFGRLVNPNENINNKLKAGGFKVRKRYKLVKGLLLININPEGRFIAEDKKVRFLKERIEELRQSGMFRYVEPNYYMNRLLMPDDVGVSEGDLWGLMNFGQNNGTEDADIDADEAWDITTGNKDEPITVAVIDTGIRATHADLATQLWTNPDEIPGNGVDDDDDGYVDNMHGIDPYWGDGDPDDLDGHGTHCAGTIGAAANNQENGLPKSNPHVGVAWDVKILACKVGTFWFSLDAIIDSIEFCVQEGVTVANCSFGGMTFSQAMFDSFAAGGEEGIMFACAAGNYSMNNDATPFYPCSFDLECVISVAATNRKDNLASFTHYGEESVDLGAPGVDIFSTIADDDNAYDLYDGTSMAAPHVAGVLALMRGLQPDWSNLQIREKVLASVDIMDSYEGLVATSGRINAYKAVDGMTGLPVPDGIMEVAIVPPSGSMLLAGSTTNFLATVIDGIAVNDATVISVVEMEDYSNEFYFSNDGDYPDELAGDNVYSNQFTLPKDGGKMKMTLIVTAPGKEPFYRVAKYDVVPLPGNDHFENAYKIASFGESVEGYNTFATLEPGEPVHTDSLMQSASLWWDWTAPADGMFYADVKGSEINTILAVYVGESFETLDKLVDNRATEQGDTDYVRWKGRKGRTYRICVAGHGQGDKGYVRLRVEVNGQPDITPPFVKVNKPINGISLATNRVELAGIAMDPQPNASGLKEVVISVNGKPGVTVTGRENWRLMVNLERGVNIFDVFGVDYFGNISEPASLAIDHRPPDVPNDHFIDAIEANKDVIVADGLNRQYTFTQKIESISSVVIEVNDERIGENDVSISEINSRILIFNTTPNKGDIIEVSFPIWVSAVQETVKATRENGEPRHAGNEGGGSIWYKYEAPTDGILSVNTLGGTFDTLLAMYMGNSVYDLQLLAENDEDESLEKNEDNPGFSRVEHALEKGMIVYIAVDGFGGERGEARIKTEFQTSPIHRLSVVANDGGTLVSPATQPLKGNDGSFTLFVHNGVVQLKVKPHGGYVFDGWEGSINSMDNPINLHVTKDMAIKANFSQLVVTENFESGAFDRNQWKTSGDSDWIVQSKLAYGGKFAAKAGKIDDGEISSLTLDGDFSGGEGTFDVRASSEKSRDKLIFLMDGKILGEWSGVTDWENFTFDIKPGKHTLEWRYKKDFANSYGNDTAWIDNVDVPLRNSASLALESSGDTARLRLWGSAGHRYDVEVSSDFVNWEKWDSVFIDAEGVKLLEKVIDLNGEETRFFRAIAP